MTDDVIDNLHATTRRILDAMIRDFVDNGSWRYVRQVADLVRLRIGTVRPHIRELYEQRLLTEERRVSGNGYEYRPSPHAFARYLERERELHRLVEDDWGNDRDRWQKEKDLLNFIIARQTPVPRIPLNEAERERLHKAIEEAEERAKAPKEEPQSQEAQEGPQEAPDGPPAPERGQGSPEGEEAQEGPSEAQERAQVHKCPVCRGAGSACVMCNGTGKLRCVRVV